ncbi:MAG: hypothetical protein COB78_01150 [Hyphomicrobiales bacterium]|nr:MAG: hypothetical protein COB78_01150 [Hyphomicrobiales bacterium]
MNQERSENHKSYGNPFTGLIRQLRWSYLPPLMVYLAAGISGLTAIVGAFFVKDYLGLSATFLAGLAFWAGIPWALKMPLGHLVDLIWRWKFILVYIGASLITCSILIMYGLIAYTDQMTVYMGIEAWFVTSALLAPIGYVVQDVVADAMTVEAVPARNDSGVEYTEQQSKTMHTTMQTLGRFAIISGFVFVAALNIFMFSGVENMTQADKIEIYSKIYLAALVVPVISIAGVMLGQVMVHNRAKAMRAQKIDETQIEKLLYKSTEETKPNWWIFGGSAVFIAFTLFMGLGDFTYGQEIIFVGSMAIVLFMMSRLIRELDQNVARALVGTAVIIFMFRATPSPGAGALWFEIDILGFDQQFLSVLSLFTSGLTLLGMVMLRPLMATKSIAFIIVFLTIAAGILSLPNIGLFYGLHHWTAAWSGGIVDARFIAILDTAIESPLGQIAMIPMLAWIAKNAPANLKATFFAVMASFTNLALSASALATKYLNKIFTVTREVKDRTTGEITIEADYNELGMLLITATIIIVILPLAAVIIVQNSRFKTAQ